MVMTWAEIEDTEVPGNIEGFYCSVKYNSGEETGKNVDVETFEGTKVDFASMTGDPNTWCPPPGEGEEPTGCKRHSVAQWQEWLTF